MIDLRADQNKNRLYAILGPIDTGEGKHLFRQIKFRLNLITSGFSWVADFTSFTINDPDEILS
ncbi:MAG: hypothetical protein HN417_06720 [Desulfobacula sp.]|jgi:hypothetical protein|nr:hypothetical protein [Desulfobacula sp.]MBT7261611.1 hypothetical protein [Desulfobacula sp.]